MRLTELTNRLEEGPNDPQIFKAVFMAGGPGSGKSTVARILFSGSGLKFVDLDRFESMARGRGQSVDYHSERDYDRFWQLASQQKQNYLLGRLGMLIDGTAKDLSRIVQQKHWLEQMGYECAMVFVNATLEKAQARVLSRAEIEGRPVPSERVITSWNAAQRNIGQLQDEFGSNFFIVDNSGGMPKTETVERKLRHFLDTPPRSPIARRWLDQARSDASTWTRPEITVPPPNQESEGIREDANVIENFADGRNPQDRGDSARHGIPKKVSLITLDRIVHSKSASPRKKQLAHWQANMRRGRAK